MIFLYSASDICAIFFCEWKQAYSELDSRVSSKMPRPSASKEGSTNKKGSQIAKAKDSKKPKAEKKGSATAKHKGEMIFVISLQNFLT